jgi:hypothetical protein
LSRANSLEDRSSEREDSKSAAAPPSLESSASNASTASAVSAMGIGASVGSGADGVAVAPAAMSGPVVVPALAEVCVFFANRLLKGSRVDKSDAIGWAAFESPNDELLGQVNSEPIANDEAFERIRESRRYAPHCTALALRCAALHCSCAPACCLARCLRLIIIRVAGAVVCCGVLWCVQR